MKKIFLIVCMALTFGHSGAQQRAFSSEKTQVADSVTWLKQVEFAKKAASQMDEIKLTGHHYLGKITSQEQIDGCWKQLLGDDTQVVMFPNKDDYDTFDIVPLKQERQRLWNLYKQDLKVGYRQSLDTVVTFGTELVELEWEYKGKTVLSLGIIFHGKLVFDHIGSALTVPGTKHPEAKPVVKTRVYKSEEEMLQRMKEIKEEK